MTAQNCKKMADPSESTPATTVGQLQNVAYPLETRMDKGIQWNVSNNSQINLADPTRPTIPLFVTPGKAAELTGWGLTTIKRHCREGKFQGAQKILIDGNESWQIPISSLPPEAQAKMATEMHADIVARAAANKPSVPAVQGNHAAIEMRAMWDAYERSGDATKKKAETLFAAVSMFEELTLQGFTKGRAEKEVLATHGVKKIRCGAPAVQPTGTR